MPHRKTLVFCCNTTFAIVNFRSGVIRALIAQGHKVVVVAPPDDHVPAVFALGARFEPWSLDGRGTSIMQEIQAIRRLKKILSHIQPDLCFFYTIKCVLYGALACKRLRIPFISVITGLGYAFINETWVSHVARMFYRRTLKWSRELWFLNKDDHATFAQHGLLPPSHPTRILPGEGVDTHHFDALPLSASSSTPGPVFLMIARLLKDKGVLEYLEAAKQLKNKFPDARCQLLGESNVANPSAISRAEVQTWQDQGWIDYLGTTKDVRPLIAQADCVVLPSYREGAPRVLMEAAAMRRPLIATDAPGCRDMLIDGQTGFLCQVKNADDLTQKMIRFSQMPRTEWIDMGARGRVFIEQHYDESLVIQVYRSACTSIVG